MPRLSAATTAQNPAGSVMPPLSASQAGSEEVSFVCAKSISPVESATTAHANPCRFIVTSSSPRRSPSGHQRRRQKVIMDWLWLIPGVRCDLDVHRHRNTVEQGRVELPLVDRFNRCGKRRIRGDWPRTTDLLLFR